MSIAAGTMKRARKLPRFHDSTCSVVIPLWRKLLKRSILSDVRARACRPAGFALRIFPTRLPGMFGARPLARFVKRLAAEARQFPKAFPQPEDAATSTRSYGFLETKRGRLITIPRLEIRRDEASENTKENRQTPRGEGRRTVPYRKPRDCSIPDLSDNDKTPVPGYSAGHSR